MSRMKLARLWAKYTVIPDSSDCISMNWRWAMCDSGSQDSTRSVSVVRNSRQKQPQIVLHRKIHAIETRHAALRQSWGAAAVHDGGRLPAITRYRHLQRRRLLLHPRPGNQLRVRRGQRQAHPRQTDGKTAAQLLPVIQLADDDHARLRMLDDLPQGGR